MHITDLTASHSDLVEETAKLLHRSFLDRAAAWPTLTEARKEVEESLQPGRISRVLLDTSEQVIGWIGGLQAGYEGRVWELHPLVVDESHRRRGHGRTLVEDLERIVSERGCTTLLLGTDDENHETTLGGSDLYDDIPGAIRDIRNLKGHPYEFYLRLGFTIIGVVPDANGPGKPDIIMAKRMAS